MFFVLLKAGQGRADDETAHGMTNQTYFRNLARFGNLVVYFRGQSHAHVINLSFSSSFVRRRYKNSHLPLIVSSKFNFQLLHIQTASSKPMDQNNQKLLFQFFLLNWLIFDSFFLEDDRSIFTEETFINNRKFVIN